MVEFAMVSCILNKVQLVERKILALFVYCTGVVKTTQKWIDDEDDNMALVYLLNRKQHAYRTVWISEFKFHNVFYTLLFLYTDSSESQD